MTAAVTDLRSRSESPEPFGEQDGISVIIPTLDEEVRIGAQLARVTSLAGVHEVIVVDGGSSDGTVAIARSTPGVRVVTARRGRAAQMNAGAHAARHAVLLFLHADVTLPRDAVCYIEDALSEPRVVAGAFRTWTVPDVEPSRMRALLHLADVRSRYSSLPYGDQALFVRASAFRRVGGYAELPLMEDIELARRLRRMGKIRTVRPSVRVSGRRFLARPVYFTLLVNIFPLLYRLGVPASTLADWYEHVR